MNAQQMREDLPSQAESLRREISAGVLVREPLGPYTSLGLGGPADLFVNAGSRADLSALLGFCSLREIPVTPIGDGSNLLVSDLGVRGLVLKLGGVFDSVEIDGCEVSAGAGAGLSQTIAACARAGLAGLEVVYGVPGSVGGGVFMNAGTRYGCIADVVVEAEVVGLAGQPRRMAAKDMQLSYRSSVFHEMPRQDIIIGAKFHLAEQNPGQIRDRIAAIAEDRRKTQPVSSRSCGCIFRNPEGDSAGRLIDAAGMKGGHVGGVAVSDRHANFFVRNGDATASDVLCLARRTAAAVSDRFGVELELEVRLIGEWPDE